MTFEDGSSSHTLVRVPYNELEAWENNHDAVGRTTGRDTTGHDSNVHGVVVETKNEKSAVV